MAHDPGAVAASAVALRDGRRRIAARGVPRGSGSDILNNNIGFSGHFGVAIADGAPLVRVFANSFTDNAGLAIDVK